MSRTPTHAKRFLLVLAAVVAVFSTLALPRGAAAAEDFTYTFLLQGGAGGPINEDSGSSAGFETGFQVGLTMVASDDIHVGGRVGSLDFESSDNLGPFAGPTLDYISLGGDYRFNEGFYRSGIYIGLGYYRLEGDVLLDPDGATAQFEETGAGVALGVTGEFELAPKMGIQIELLAHLTDLDAQDFFGTAMVGFAFHF